MSQRIKPDRPIWPSLPETGPGSVPAPQPAGAPRAAGPDGGQDAAGPRARRIAPATAEAFGSLAG